MRKPSISVAFIIALLLGIIVPNVILWDAIPPGAMTRTRMGITENGLRNYYSAKKKVPATLAALPPGRANCDNSILDAWGRPIQYEVNGTTITLLSYGANGCPGGDGEDKDIITTFAIDKPTTFPWLEECKEQEKQEQKKADKTDG